MRRAAAFAGALVAACAVPEPELVPLRREVHTVAVWPAVAEPFAPLHELLLTGAEAALRARGYTVIPAAVAAELLRGVGLDAARAEPGRCSRVLTCDTVLVLVPHDFVAAGERPLRHAAWDLEWRLVSTRDGVVVWESVNRGSWHAATDDGRDPHRPLDAEPEIVPIGGRGPANHRDAGELLAALHRSVLGRLPAKLR